MAEIMAPKSQSALLLVFSLKQKQTRIKRKIGTAVDLLSSLKSKAEKFSFEGIRSIYQRAEKYLERIQIQKLQMVS